MYEDAKTIGYDKAKKAMEKGAELMPLQFPFFSAGLVYDHLLITSRTEYRVCRQIAAALLQEFPANT